METLPNTTLQAVHFSADSVLHIVNQLFTCDCRYMWPCCPARRHVHLKRIERVTYNSRHFMLI